MSERKQPIPPPQDVDKPSPSPSSPSIPLQSRARVEDRSLTSVLARLDRLERIVVCMFKAENLGEARELVKEIERDNQ